MSFGWDRPQVIFGFPTGSIPSEDQEYGFELRLNLTVQLDTLDVTLAADSIVPLVQLHLESGGG